jgi:16S rRNA (cytosine967-C5)-methyltransferase
MTPDASTPTSSQIRAHVARAINLIVTENRTIDWVLQERPQWSSTPLEKAMLFGVIRHYLSLEKFIDELLTKPLRSKDLDLYLLMLVGAYQLKFTDIPHHAAINETVKAVAALHKPWAKGLINGVLRNAARKNYHPDQSFDHPAWLAAAIRAEYPEQGADILAANITRAPMTLRVNQQIIERDVYNDKLIQAEIQASKGLAPNSLILKVAQPSASLPGWADGEVAIQDMGAQFAAELLKPGDDANIRVLDACTAPGGKLANLLENASPAASPGEEADRVFAIDISNPRIEQTQLILRRLGHQIEIKQADASHLAWWDNRPFTHILLDAPCSGTGTIRRHPDIKLLLQLDAIAQHATLQLQLLNNLWQTLAPGGNLLYCTCSLLQAENDDVIERFLEGQNKDGNNNANVLPINLRTGVATKFGWQLLPTDPNTDGFYYALLHKSAMPTAGMTSART